MRKVSGFTLWELLVVIALVIIFFVAALQNILPLRGTAERAAVTMMYGNLNSAVALESMRRLVSGGPSAVDSMDGGNPFAWFSVQPSSYVGERKAAAWRDMPPGSWAYDPGSGTIFYRVRYSQYFSGNFSTPPGIRFRVVAGNRKVNAGSGALLEQIDEGQWSTSGMQLLDWVK